MASFSNESVFSNSTIQEAVSKLLELATEYGVLDEMKEIIEKGSYKGLIFNTEECINDFPECEAQRRISMGYLLLTNRDSLEKIVEKKVQFFHGTDSRALPDIAKSGLNSLAESRSKGIDVLTGEKWSRIKGYDRDFISVTDIFDIAENYTRYEEKNKGFFPVIIGINNDCYKSKSKITPRDSEICEIGILKHISLDEISVIMVPSEKIKIVKKMVNNSNVDVIGVDMIENRFFMMLMLSSENYSEDKYQIFKELLASKRTSFSFKLAEIQEFVKNNLLSKFSNKESRDKNEPIYK